MWIMYEHNEILKLEWHSMLFLSSSHLLRYKNELDRSQPAGSSSFSSSEIQLYTTPQKSFSTPAPAYRHQGILVGSHLLCLTFMLLNYINYIFPQSFDLKLYFG